MPESHSYLVERAGKWLRGSMGCCPVFTEHKCWATSESPDAFGINSVGTVVVECKTSISDFYADRRKAFRHKHWEGMGSRRYYMTPQGLLTPAQLATAPGWGLLEVLPKTIRCVRASDEFLASSNDECLLLRSAWLHKRDMSAGIAEVSL